MKNILIALVAFFTLVNINSVYANDQMDTNNNDIQEVELDIDNEFDVTEEETQLEVSVEENSENTVHEEKTLKNKLKDAYGLKVEKYNKPSYLFKEALTHKYSENSPLDSTHLWAAYIGAPGIEFKQGGSTHRDYDFKAINVGYDGVFKDHNADFRVMLRFVPDSSRNFAQELFGDVFVATNKVPHHRFQLGYFRPQIGQEGGISSFVIPYLNRAQISRNFGTARKLGGRVIGKHDLIDYDLGLYSSDTYLQEFFPGAEFTSWVTLKPLAKTNGKYGHLRIAGGVDAGHRSNNFCVTGAYIGYDYKRFMANVEWAQANGYNGNHNQSSPNHAGGMYATLGYMLTDKLQLLARYDQYDPNQHKGNDKKQEYSLGLNYFIKGQALRLMVNYIFCHNEGNKDSHRILLGTQIML